MKKPVSLKLSPEMDARLETLKEASGLKKNTIIERCIEAHLPELEKRYAKELAECQARRKLYAADRRQRSELNEGKR